MSDFHITGKTEERGQYPREFGPSGLRVELTGFETAKVNRTQRSTQGGQGNGYQGNVNSQPQSGAQDDPWAVPATSNAAGGWGNGPDSEPPF